MVSEVCSLSLFSVSELLLEFKNIVAGVFQIELFKSIPYVGWACILSLFGRGLELGVESGGILCIDVTY